MLYGETYSVSVYDYSKNHKTLDFENGTGPTFDLKYSTNYQKRFLKKFSR